MEAQFPFGAPVRRVEQEDRSPKKVFVLGVYASAVHARWKREGKTVCPGLAVAGEPRVFWDGNETEARQIIGEIILPPGAGELSLPGKRENGPSGRALLPLYLEPLGYRMEEAWLANLLPEPCIGPSQLKAVRPYYESLAAALNLPPITAPIENGRFCDERRAEELREEILLSGADTILPMGDVPIRQFLYPFCGFPCRRLAEYTERYGYGTPCTVLIGGKTLKVWPVAHPTLLGSMGKADPLWQARHALWMEERRAER
ncbi:MAG TPA: hypothetical protein PKY19_02850 [Oscillospiraceae bacterium]|nr:hypothetical protein [Oscillospiraceae bacterium]HXK77404.1 hypothetical protein [Oscillospiraceae bacterium]